MPDAAASGDAIMLRGKKNMLATECSRPTATKAEMGKMMARIFPATSRAAMASHTARQTRMLHKIPRKKSLTEPQGHLRLYKGNRLGADGAGPDVAHARHKFGRNRVMVPTQAGALTFRAGSTF